MRKSGLGKLKGALSALRSMFPMAPAKRELAEVKRDRDLVKLSPGEQEKRELMLKGALDNGSMVALVGTENRIAQMVAEQTRGFRAQINEMHGHVSALSQRLMYLEQPDRPKLGEVGSGTGVFPRSHKRKSDTSEIAGRPGRFRDAVAEGVAGEMARHEPPSKLEARTLTDAERLGGRNVQYRGELLGKPPSVSYVTGTAEEVSAARERLQRADMDELRRMASAGAPLIDVDRYSGIDPPDPNSGAPGPYIQTR